MLEKKEDKIKEKTNQNTVLTRKLRTIVVSDFLFLAISKDT